MPGAGRARRSRGSASPDSEDNGLTETFAAAYRRVTPILLAVCLLFAVLAALAQPHSEFPFPELPRYEGFMKKETRELRVGERVVHIETKRRGTSPTRTKTTSGSERAASTRRGRRAQSRCHRRRT